jgi:transposase-like protein
MRYPASEKLEIIRLVEQSHLPTKRTIDKLGIPRTTIYRWYDKYLTSGAEATSAHKTINDVNQFLFMTLVSLRDRRLWGNQAGDRRGNDQPDFPV